MSICIGFIPNKDIVMMLQDSEITHTESSLMLNGKKINRHGDKFFIGAVGSKPLSEQVNGIIAKHDLDKINDYESLQKLLQDSYHRLRHDKFTQGVLRKYGIEDEKVLTSRIEDSKTNKEIQLQPEFKNHLLNVMDDSKFFPLELMIITYFEKPRIATTLFPGETSTIMTKLKEFYTLGVSEASVKIKMKELISEYRWSDGIPEKEAIDILIKAGNESAKYCGVGGPFEIVMINKIGRNERKLTELDSRKLNMVMFMDRMNALSNGQVGEFYKKLLSELVEGKVSSEKMYAEINKNFDTGYEFKKYFKK